MCVALATNQIIVWKLQRILRPKNYLVSQISLKSGHKTGTICNYNYAIQIQVEWSSVILAGKNTSQNNQSSASILTLKYLPIILYIIYLPFCSSYIKRKPILIYFLLICKKQKTVINGLIILKILFYLIQWVFP